MNKFLPAIFAFASMFLYGCGPNYLLEGRHDFPDTQWTYADSLRFEFEVEDTTRIYNLYAELTHSVDYSFQNLYTHIHTIMPSGQRLTKLVSLELTNKLGIWSGDCNSKTCEIRLPVQEDLYFNQVGHYTIVVEQFMRQDQLPGLDNFSLLIEESEKKRQ
ncbi:MAG: gliding motility lipoprotein GldH [Saprospiraceae bacterium]|nr:gliding motility lipoprotein GldH [Saprospiraceae bacterium]MDZ4704399.1 gliding motility lipoprotein GldH [Saprospiraceae bacterium]